MPQQEDDLPALEMGDPTEQTVPPSQPVAQVRAQKATMGLGQAMNTTYPDVYQKIAGGKEDEFRADAATTLNYKAAMSQEKAILDAYTKKGSSLTQQEAMNVLDPFDANTKPANPADVIERAYATSYLSSMDTADAYMRDTVLSSAARETPEQLADKRDVATGATTKIEVAKTLRDNVDTEISNQGWAPWAIDQAKTMFQPYNEYKLRGQDPDVGVLTGGLLLGDNIRKQADDLWLMPTDQAVSTLNTIVGNLKKDNPTLARQFLDYFIGTSTNERLMDNMFTILAPSDYAAVGKGGVGLLRKIEVNNRAGAAFKQMVQQAAKQDTLHVPLQAVAQETAGDVPGAAATRAADNLAKLQNGTLSPVLDTKESLMSGFRLDGDLFDSNPGNMSREGLTRYKDSFYNAGDKLYSVIQNVLKVIRTPESLRNEDALRAYMDAERTRYKGLENAILDIHSPAHMPETNTYWVAHDFGNEDGRLFSDAETATNWAKSHGFAEPRVLEATGDVEKAPAGEAGSRRDFNRRRQLEEGISYNQQVLDASNAFVKQTSSKKFVGPVHPDRLAEATSNIENIPDVLTKMQTELGKVKKRIVATDPIIEQNGLGYKVQILRPYREDDPVVQQWLVSSAKSKSSASMTNWDSWKNSWLGYVRAADDTLAFNDSLNRKIANYTQSALRQWAKEEAKSIEAIANRFSWYKPQTWYKAIGNKQMFEEFNQALKNAKDIRDPNTKELGYFFKTPGELQDHYQRWFQRLPTDAETQAYFSHVKILEANRVLSEIAEFRNRARIGAEQHQVFFLGKDGTRMGSGFFDGIEQKQFPGGSDQILVLGGHQGDERIYHLGAGEIAGKDLSRYREAVEKGHAKIIRVYDPDSRPFKGWSTVGDNRIRYVMVTDSESKPLAFNHVNRRGGGHFDVDSDWYVKQANMVTETAGDAKNDKRRVVNSTYIGDRTFSPVENRVMGHDIAGKMTKMNELMRESKIDEAKALAKKMGIEWDKVEGWYKPKTAENGHVIGPPSIDWNEPFRLVPRNKKIYDLDNDLEKRHGLLFKDGTKSGSDALQYKVAYNEARDSENLHTFVNSGTHENPVYNFVPAKFVDPIPSLNRAMNRAITSTFMDDYKIHAVSHWIEEAGPYLKDGIDAARSAPFWYFNNADKGAFKPAADVDRPGLLDNLLSNRFKIRQFIGIPNKVDTYIHGATQLLVDQFYKKYGSESERSLVGKAFTVVPLQALSKVTNASALRSFAFNAKLGLFSIPQFLVQSQSFANIWAISPRAAGPGTMATMFHTWARINRNPEVLNAMDKMASRMGWRLGEWKEANAELAKTGFEHVGGEYLLSDDQMQHRFFRNQWGNFLDAGQVFFKEGERATRTGAYYTSFYEWRRANPTKVLTDYDRAEILQKADLLTNNMSRASASAVNSSLLSIPTQFLNYQIRLGELFLGKRLGGTTTERVAARARLMGFYAALYGVPSAISVTGYPDGAIPFISSIREYAINNGYVVGDNQLEDLAMNGIPAWTMAMVSGGLDYKKGNQYNVGDRYGTQGLTILRESMRSDESVWKLITGAAGSTIGNTIASVDPVWQTMKSMVSDDEEGNTFKLTPSHLNNIFSEIQSVDSVKRLIYAIHTGRWLSHNEQYIENVTGLDALYRTITGLHSQQQDDIWSLHDIKSQEEDAQKAAEKLIIQDYHRGIQATVDNDPDSAKTYFTNARARMIAAGIPMDRRASLMAAGSRDFEPQIETSVRQWAEKNVPYGQEATRQDAYQRFLQLQDYRNK